MKVSSSMGKNKKERKDGEDKSPHSAATVCVSGLPYSITNAQPEEALSELDSTDCICNNDCNNRALLYVNGEEEKEEEEEDKLWREMALAQESSKVMMENSQGNNLIQVEEDCEHFFICKDDIGEVCRVCGLIKTPIQNMIEVVFK